MNSFKPKIPPEVLDVIAVLEKSGFDTWIVGGSIRNHLLGRDIQDWDLATQAKPEECQNIFPHAKDTGMPFGGLTIGGAQITTLRKEGLYKDFRRPQSVEFCMDITQDLSRRDFTINAIAYRVVLDAWVDPFGGREDVKNKALKCVGDPLQRMTEDALRIFRAFRFASQYDLTMDNALTLAIAQKKELVRYLSAERIVAEWKKILLGPHVCKVLPLIQDTLTFDFLPWQPHHLDRIDQYPSVFWIRMLALFDEKQIQSNELFPKKWVDFGLTKKEAQFLISSLRFLQNELSPLQKVKWVQFLQDHIDQRQIEEALERKAPSIYRWIQAYRRAYPGFSLQNLPLSTQEIMDTVKMEPGPELGLVLQEMHQWIVENPSKATQGGLESWLKKRYMSKGEN